MGVMTNNLQESMSYIQKDSAWGYYDGVWGLSYNYSRLGTIL